MELSLNIVKEKDLPLIVAWHKEHCEINFPDSKYKPDLFQFSLTEQLQKIEKGEKAVMWLIKGEMGGYVGFLWLKLLFDIYKDYHYCDLHYIHLILEYRNKGYGTELLKIADKWAKEQGAKEIRLGTAFSNKQAMRCYHNNGYKIKRVIMEKKYE